MADSLLPPADDCRGFSGAWQRQWRVARAQDHTVNGRVNYNFNNQWLASTIVQYNNTDSFWGVNFRLNYIFRPGDDFFLIYTEGRRVGGDLEGEKDRILQTKLTYSFDF